MAASPTVDQSRQCELPLGVEVPSAESLRHAVARTTPRALRSELGQFMTPEPIARFMASMFRVTRKPVALLEPAAGLGALATAAIERWRCGDLGRGSFRLDAYEIDDALRTKLEVVLHRYRSNAIDVRTYAGDYIRQAVQAIEAGPPRYTHAILNPPYKKIATASEARLLARRVGLETVNLYSVFVGLALEQLQDGGQLVAIIPRSFCNGPYYLPFRQRLVGRAAIRRIHLFESRSEAFGDDEVLQENVILLLERGSKQRDVEITTSQGGTVDAVASRTVAWTDVVKKDDPNLFIHIPVTADVDPLANHAAVRCSLQELGLGVSTGPVVDFRLKDHLRREPSADTVPLLYPGHLSPTVRWPFESGKKPNAIARNATTERWLLPAGTYTVVRRFSAKEERRRVVASIVEPTDLPATNAIGFENHLNVFHEHKRGLRADVAWGLYAYLNSTVVDEHLRRFSGHTQVNATDLRALPYPTLEALATLGRWAASVKVPEQQAIDARVAKLMAPPRSGVAKRRTSSAHSASRKHSATRARR